MRVTRDTTVLPGKVIVRTQEPIHRLPDRADPPSIIPLGLFPQYKSETSQDVYYVSLGQSDVVLTLEML